MQTDLIVVPLSREVRDWLWNGDKNTMQTLLQMLVIRLVR